MSKSQKVIWCGDSITSDFIVSNVFGVRGLPSSSTITSRRELTIAATSYIKVRRLLVSILPPYFFSKTDSTFLAKHIILSQTPPIWLAEGGLSLNSRTPISVNFEAALTKFLPWSHLISLTAPLNLRQSSF